MKLKKKFLCLLSISAATITFLAGCNQSKNGGNETIDIDGHPAVVSFQRDPNLTLPDWFNDKIIYTDDKADQKHKFVFDAKPGEDIQIANPSPEAITKEDIERDLKIRDAYFVPSKDANRTVLYGDESPYLKYTLVDPVTRNKINKVMPNSKAILRLEEPTKGGDLTIYEKNKTSPINFDGKDPSVSELIVATERDEVEEYDPNDEDIQGLLYSKCVDTMDLTHSIEGQFVYSENVSLLEGDQFYIGDNQEFDETATFYTFLSKEKRADGYLITYTVPDYEICFNKFDIHHKETECNFDDLDEKDIIKSIEDKKDELLRSLESDGTISNIIDEAVSGELRDNEQLSREVFGRDWNPSISFNMKIKSFVVSVGISFNFGGPQFCMSFKIGFNAVISKESYGSWLLSGNVDLFFRKTFSTYTDFSIKLFPVPKINYIVAVKTISEWSLNFYMGVSFGMRPAEETVNKEDAVEELNDDISEAMSNVDPIQGDASSDLDPSEGGEIGPLDPNENTVDEIEPILSYHSDKPNRAIGGDNQDYGDDALGKKRYSGNGMIISGPGIPITIGPVTIEIGVAVVIMPDIQGRFFIAYNHVSCEIAAKVVKGFETPEGYGDDVEYARSRFVVGIYVKLGFEIGIMLEIEIYPTGCKSIFYASIQGTFGVYFAIQGVGCIIFGSDVDTTFMVYCSIEMGLFVRVTIVLNILDDTFIVNIKAFEKKWPPFFAFGTNLHFIQFIDQKTEFDWFGGKYIYINELDILNLMWFSTQSFTVGDGHFDWFYSEYFSSTGGSNYKRLFKKLEILEGEEYISFDPGYGYFEVANDAPDMFDFKFKVSIDPWLGVTCDPETFTIHYFSDKLRAITFEGYDNPHEEGSVHVGGGILTQGEVYQAPNMPNKEDGTPFVGWLGNNGLFLQPLETMEVGSMSITFTPVYKRPVTYTVSFYDGYNNLICSQNILAGGKANEPNAETRDAKMNGAKFICWDRAFDNVYSNMNVYGIYATGGQA